MLTKGFAKKKYNSMLIANLLGWTVCIIGSLADSIIAGMFISEDAVSATGLVNPVFSMSFFFSLLIATGVAAVYSYTAGAFEVEKAKRVNGTGLVLAVISGILMAALFYFGRDLFFSFYSTSAEIEAMARDYYKWYIIIGLVYPVYWTVYSWVSVDGDATLVMLTDAFTAFANAGFSIILVQKMGVEGLALGTLLSTVCSTLILSIHFLKKNNSIHVHLCLDKGIAAKIILAGSPMALGTLYVGVVDLIMNKFVIVYVGEQFLAAYAIVNLMVNLIQISNCAMDSAGPFVGIAHGEKNNVAMRAIMKRCTISALTIGVVMGAVFEALAPMVPGLYGIVTPDVYDASVLAVRIISASFIFGSLIFIWSDYFPKTEKAGLGNITAFFYEFITPMIPTIPIAMKWGFTGLVWGFFLNPIITILLMSIVIIARYGIKAWPFIILDNDNTVFMHEFALKDDEIITLRNIAGEELTSAGVSHEIINKVQLMIEELCEVIKKKNETAAAEHGRKMKKILDDCTLIVNEDSVQLIMRDNGVIFDVTDCDADITSLSQYVVNRLIDDDDDNTYMTTVSFNRSCYIWERA